jgi:Fe-S cluster assembly protein SufD
MLSEKSRGDANPILLIDENEVTAGHAASVGRVDPDELFYFLLRYARSR